MRQSQSSQTILDGLRVIPSGWQLTPVNGKRPIFDAWQTQKTPIAEIHNEIESGRATGYGLVLGESSWHNEQSPLLSVDFDGEGTHEHAIELNDGRPLPETVAWTSGKPGRHQRLYAVPIEFVGELAGKREITSPNGSKFELRYNGHQSVLPPSHHPETGGYQWLTPPAEIIGVGELNATPIPYAPQWMIDILLIDNRLSASAREDTNPEGDRAWAIEYMQAICDNYPSDDRSEWIRVGHALKSVLGDEGFPLWDAWSAKSVSYGDRKTRPEYRWSGFKPRQNGIAVLGYFANKAGWKPKVPETRPGQSPLEGKATQQQIREEVQTQLHQSFEDFPLNTLLPSLIAPLLIEFSIRLNAPQGVFGAALLTICASLLKVGTVIKLPGGTGHTEPPILWTCVCGESGNAKTPVQNILLKGLNQLSLDSYILWQNAQEQHEQDLLNWEAKPKKDRDKPAPKPPNRRVYKLNNLTTEGVVLKQSQQPENGFAITVDELAGFFKSLNQYKKGGDDLEAWLSFYDGGGVEQVRVSRADIYLQNVGFSVFGGIQPCKLKKAMGDLTQQDGFFPRYSYVRIPTQRMPNPEDLPDIDTSAIETLYRKLDKLPKREYTLSLEARQVWRDWNEWIEDRKLAEGHEALRVLYPKARARAARVALVLTAIKQCCGNGEPEVNAEVLNVAIAFTKWMLRQTLSIYDELGLADNPESDRIARFVARFKDAGWIKAKAVTHWSSSSNKLKAQEARNFMAKVVSLGFAKSNDKSPSDSGYEISIIQEIGNSVTGTPQKLSSNGTQPVTVFGTPSVTPVTSESNGSKIVTGVTSQLPPSVTRSKPCSDANPENELPSYRGFEILEKTLFEPEVEHDDDY